MYSSVDPVKVHLAATVGLSELERFAGEVSSWVQDSAEPVSPEAEEGPQDGSDQDPEPWRSGRAVSRRGNGFSLGRASLPAW